VGEKRGWLHRVLPEIAIILARNHLLYWASFQDQQEIILEPEKGEERAKRRETITEKERRKTRGGKISRSRGKTMRERN